MDYFDRPELSSSQVAAYLTDPIRWYHEHVAKDWLPESPTEAMKFGTIVHSMIEAGSCDSVVKRIPRSVLNKDGHRKGKSWLAWKRANPAQFYIGPNEANPFTTVWEHLTANSWCRNLIENGSKEVIHIWNDPDLGPCRCKFDVILSMDMPDWKTTNRKTDKGFTNEIGERFYDVRLSLYRRGFADLFGVKPKTYPVAIQNSGSYSVTPYRLDEDWLDDAEARLITAVYEMKQFKLPEHLDREPKIIKQPRYATRFQTEPEEAYA